MHLCGKRGVVVGASKRPAPIAATASFSENVLDYSRMQRLKKIMIGGIGGRSRFGSWVIAKRPVGNYSLTIFRHRVEQVWNWTA